MTRIRITRWGIEDPVGLIVKMPWEQRTLLGKVTDTYRSETRGMWHLRVRHFNGEMWPLEPTVSAVEIV